MLLPISPIWIFIFHLSFEFIFTECQYIDEIKKVHQWAVGIQGGQSVAENLAHKFGLTFKHRVSYFSLY